MKKLIRNLIAIGLIGACGSIFADTVVTEVGVPIEVDSAGNTYTVVSKPDYYYYSGHRCYREKRTDVVGVNFLGLRAAVGGGSEVYCYPYP